VREKGSRLDGRGYGDYRRSDALALRWLRHGQVPLGQLATTLGVSRQAARKVVDGLVARSFASVQRDQHDARRLNVALTVQGTHYAQAVAEVVKALNEELEAQIDPYDLVVVKAVLRSVSTLYGNDGKSQP
jgi:DNA-binding MarR family transcriptional regulator